MPIFDIIHRDTGNEVSRFFGQNPPPEWLADPDQFIYAETPDPVIEEQPNG